MVATGGAAAGAYLLMAGEHLDKPYRATKAHVAYSVKYSPDGSLLIVPEPHKAALILRASDLSLVRTPQLQDDDVGQFYTAAFSPDGQLAAAGSTGDWADKGGVVKIWRTSDGSLVRTLGPLSGQAAHVEFSPDGRLLACADKNVYKGDTAKLWQVSDGKLLRQHESKVHEPYESVSFSPDGSLLAAAARGGGTEIWRVADGSSLRKLEAGGDMVRFSPDGASLVLMDARRPGLYRVANGALEWEFKPTGYVVSQAISRDGGYLAAGEADGLIDLWRFPDAVPILTIKAARKGEYTRGLDFSPDGEFLASLTSDDHVSIWRVT